MKKQILSFALALIVIGSIATGCGSSKNAENGSDTTKVKDTTKVAAPVTPAPDTTKKDTTKKDTVKH